MARVVAFVALLLVAMVAVASAASVSINPSMTNIAATLNALVAGDVATFAAGQYNLNGETLININGAAGAGITIRGTINSGAQATFISQLDNTTNVIRFAGSYFTVANITFNCGPQTGRCLGGVWLTGSTSYATFQDLVITNTNGSAFTMAQPNAATVYANNTVTRVEVSGLLGAGGNTNGFVIGCKLRACTAYSNVIEQCYAHDFQAGGASTLAGAGILLETGVYANTIRNNVVHVDVTNAAGIVCYDDDRKGVNLIESNYVYGAATSSNGIQAGSGVVIRNNVVGSGLGNAFQHGIAILPLNLLAAYHDIYIIHNTVAGSTQADLLVPSPLNLGGFTIVNNAFLSTTAIVGGPIGSSVVFSNNAIVGANSLNMVGAVITTLASAVTAGTLFPTTTSALVHAGTINYKPLTMFDFNGQARADTSANPPTIGAYENLGSNTAPAGAYTLGSSEKTSANLGPAYPQNSYGTIQSTTLTTSPSPSPSTNGGGGGGGGDGSSGASVLASWMTIFA